MRRIVQAIAEFLSWVWSAAKEANKAGVPDSQSPQPTNGNLAHAKATNEMLVNALKIYQETSGDLVKVLLKTIEDLSADREKEQKGFEKQIREIKSDLKECKEKHSERDDLESKKEQDWDKVVAHFQGEITRIQEFVMKNSTNTSDTIQGMG